MLDAEFTNEFSRRSKLFYGENGAKSLFEELESLDPRESRLIYRVFSYDADSIEYQHSKLRVTALVASGAISEKLGNIATFAVKEEKPVRENNLTPYQLSRLNMVAALDLFSVADSADNLVDPSGELEYRIERGDSKEQLKTYLESSTMFQALQESAAAVSDSEEFDSQLASYKYNQFLDALEELEDSQEQLDFAQTAKENLKDYDEYGNVSKMIDEGAKSTEIFDALEANSKWVDDAEDFITRDFVDSPRYAQTEKWNNFLRTVNSVKDLDSL